MSVAFASLLVVLTSTLLSPAPATKRPVLRDIRPAVAGPLTVPQTAASFPGVDPADVASACGPIAAGGLARAFGFEGREAALLAAAPRYGWTRAGGMNGRANFQALVAGELGLACRVVNYDEAIVALDAGEPIVISTAVHYFLAQAINAQGYWYVGNTGLALQGGSRWLTLGEIEQLGGRQGHEFLRVTPVADPGVELVEETVIDWADAARAAARAAGIDEVYFERQMRLESASYDEDVIYCRRASSAGALGIAQLMPQFHPREIACDPKAALAYAAELMASHLQRYGGDWRLALAAYNAGAGAVAQYGGVPPYAETQRYIARILGG